MSFEGCEVIKTKCPGVTAYKRKRLKDGRGSLTEIHREDSTEPAHIAKQCYITTAKPGVIKAWHMHKRQDDLFYCVNGRALVAFRQSLTVFSEVTCDGDEKYLILRKTENDKIVDVCNKDEGYFEDRLILDAGDTPLVVHIKAGVWHGFRALDGPATILNQPSNLYNYNDPDEQRRDLSWCPPGCDPNIWGTEVLSKDVQLKGTGMGISLLDMLQAV